MPSREDIATIPDDAPLALGPCCCCGGSDDVHTIVVLPYCNAVPGHGWGCFKCGLPSNGAAAVLCDACATAYRTDRRVLVEACRGYPAEDGREPIGVTHSRPAHDHDLSKHPEVSA